MGDMINAGYRYMADVNHGLTVFPSPELGCIISTAPASREPDGTRVRISVADVPRAAKGIAAAMHRVAGLPEPIILERPKLLGTHTQVVFARFGPTPDGRRLELSGLAGSLDRAIAIDLGRYIIARAQELPEKAEPDPADVKALSGTLNRIWETYDGTSEEMAREILRAGYRPPESRGDV